MGTELELLGHFLEAYQGILREIEGIVTELELVENALIKQGILPGK